MFDRREVLAGAAASALAGGGAAPMFGLHGKIVCAPGERDRFVAILTEGLDFLRTFPGCRIYVVAIDPSSADDVWVTEVWDDEAAHAASLKTPEVQALIARGRPLIVGGTRQVTRPLAGVGLG
ncbi:MAG: putative quinol monooxygenase [Phenylobacterium sp.]|jgi:quinol monooxygenase YgiN|uniref:putative quinol monooxygenase n=1 Tax=Phenylobacterium sp. TaxID=1871053 RepID=UPI00391C9FD8